MERAKLIVSLDFELYWGMQDVCTLDEYKDNLLGGRAAIPTVLEMFKKHGIHATWATVGFMFADGYEDVKKYFPDESLLPTYTTKERSAYSCFGLLGEDEETAPCYYAPSLIKMISQYPGQEIGSHTFSHYYCREDGQTVEQFEADMSAAKAIAKDKGYDVKSVVLPRNQSRKEYTEVLNKLGFTSYRDEENDWIHRKIKIRPLLKALRLLDVYIPLTGKGGYVPTNEDGIWNFVGSRMYKPFFKPLGFMEKLKVHRIKKQMLHAAKNNLVFHLWWHPHNIGVRTDFHLKQLEEIFSYYDEMKEKYNMESFNMGEMTKLMEK